MSAVALVLGALWLQHCCKSPPEPPDHPDGVPEQPMTHLTCRIAVWVDTLGDL